MTTPRRKKTPMKDAGAIFMEALRKLHPSDVATMETVVPPVIRHIADRCSAQYLAAAEDIGKAAAAARAGDVRGCRAAMRAASKSAQKLGEAMSAELARLDMTGHELAGLFLAPLPMPAIGGPRLAAPIGMRPRVPWPMS